MSEKKIWIIGGANIDIVGHADHPLKDHDSNMGRIKTSFGGVGRNIAQACAELGERVNLITCFGADEAAHLLEENCLELGIDTSFSVKSDRHDTSTYIAIMDENNDMRIAMSDMGILEMIDKETVKKALDQMTSDDILVIDSNLDSELVEYIAENTPARLASDPVSAAKSKRLIGIMGKLSIFKPNAIEAKEITGIEIVDDETAREAMSWFMAHGIEEIIITLGAKGVILGTRDGMHWITHKTVEMDSANGSGDSMMGAYLTRRLRGEEVMDAIRFAIAAAVFKLTGEKGISNLRHEEKVIQKEKSIMELIDNLDIKERLL